MSSHEQAGTVGDSSDPLTIGGSAYATIEAFAGDMDEVKMFNTALTSNQVAALVLEQDMGVDPAYDPCTDCVVEGVGGGVDASQVILYWDTIPGYLYDIHWTTNLLDGFTIIQSDLPHSVTEYIDDADEDSGFYKVKTHYPAP